MPRVRPNLLILLAALAVAGCITPQASAPLPPGGGHQGASPMLASVAPAARAIVTGRVLAPANVVASEAGKIISQNGLNIIGQNGLNIISQNGLNYRTLAAEETRIAGAEVYLADNALAPLPALPRVTSGPDGTYTIPNVPAGFSFVVVVEFKTAEGVTARLLSLASSSELGATADVDAATTLVTAKLTEGQAAGLPAYTPATFTRATDTTRSRLTPAMLPDWASPQRILDAVNQLIDVVNDLKSDVQALRDEVARTNARMSDLEQALAASAEPPDPARSSPPAPGTPATSPAPSATVAPPRVLGTFAATPITTSGVRRHVAFVVGNWLYLAGGMTPHDDAVDRAPIGDGGALGAFTRVGTLVEKRYHQAVAVTPRSVILLGGRLGSTILDSVESAPILEDGLGPFASLNEGDTPVRLTMPRSGAAAVVAGDGLLVIGGGASTSIERAPLASDGALGAFETLGDAALVVQRSGAGTIVIGDRLYVIGGSRGATFLRDTEVTRLDADGQPGPFVLAAGDEGQLAAPRSAFALVRVADWVYAIGGATAADLAVDTVERAPVQADGRLGRFEVVPGLTLTAARQFAAFAVGPQAVWVTGGAGVHAVERALIP